MVTKKIKLARIWTGVFLAIAFWGFNDTDMWQWVIFPLALATVSAWKGWGNNQKRKQ